jgi:anthranilate phosphoribosyltransferase
MIPLLKPIGKKKNARDLDPAEAAEAARLVVSGQATDVQIAAFLMGMRIKGESPTEFVAMTHALRAGAQPVRPQRPVSLEIGGPFDGRESSFAAGIAAALVLASSGEVVALAGSDTLPPKHGVTTREILAALEVPEHPAPDASASARHAEASLDATGIAYLHLDDLCPPLARLRPIREQLGLRTMLNTVEKHLDVTGATTALSGVFHGNVLEAVSELQRALGYQKGLVVQGVEGSAEPHLGRRTNLSRLEGGEIRRDVIDPKTWGFSDPPAEVGALAAADQARRTLAVLGGAPGPDRERVLLFAMLLKVLIAGGEPEAALTLAQDALDSGTALRLLDAWRGIGTARIIG